MEIFHYKNFKIKDSKEEKDKKEAASFVPPTNEDGAATIEGSGAFGTYLDLDGTIKNEYDMITRYREMALNATCALAIDDVVNEAIVVEENLPPLMLDLSTLDVSESIKTKIQEAFKTVCKLVDWKNNSYQIFKRWYIDGRLYYHVIPEDNPRKGIRELRYIDPRQIKKIRIIERHKDEATGADLIRVVDEYYIYNQRGIQYAGYSGGTYMSQVQTVQGLRIDPTVVVYVHSGETDKFSSTIISNLHWAIKPLNQLKMMEDALVIYRISRAPERRIFYIDVGTLPKQKADDYVRSIMQRYKNKMVYDANTGELRDDRRHLSMMEDYWLPRREGSTGTQIDTLPGGENLGKMEDVEYFEGKLYEALFVPVSRKQNKDQSFNLGKSTEIIRDEIKFAKFVTRLRTRFSHLFDKLMEMQLVMTGVFSKDEWNELRDDIDYIWATDNHFAELKDIEIWNNRMDLLTKMDPDSMHYLKKYFTVGQIRRIILKQSDDDIEALEKERKKEGDKYDFSDELDQKPQNFDDSLQFKKKDEGDK